MYSNVNEVAKVLAKYTLNIYMRETLRNFYENGIDEDGLCDVFQFILEDGYDIDGFMLFEMPAEGVYCFVKSPNTPETQSFDIYTNWNGLGKTVAGYISGSEEYEASSIKEAIEKYCY